MGPYVPGRRHLVFVKTGQIVFLAITTWSPFIAFGLSHPTFIASLELLAAA